jgi:hypothetical protein
MVDECRPDAGATDGSLHWLRRHDLAPIACVWRTPKNGEWWYGNVPLSPSQAVSDFGLTYVAPASPDDAAARKQLEKDVEMLRDMLRRVMEHGISGCDGYHTLKAYDLNREIRAALAGATP